MIISLFVSLVIRSVNYGTDCGTLALSPVLHFSLPRTFHHILSAYIAGWCARFGTAIPGLVTAFLDCSLSLLIGDEMLTFARGLPVVSDFEVMDRE